MHSETSKRILPLLAATPQNLTAFGRVLGADPETPPLPIDFYGGAMQVRKPVEFVSDETTELTVVTLKRRPIELRWIERHFKHTQTFVPLGGRPFIAIMAPPNDGELPDLDQMRAFIFDGSAGFTMNIGTWHEFPFALQDDTNIIVILRAEATRDLMRDNVILDEAYGPDIDKKDLLRRTGVLFSVNVS
jgi:ureidoglycolate lyase